MPAVVLWWVLVFDIYRNKSGCGGQNRLWLVLHDFWNYLWTDNNQKSDFFCSDGWWTVPFSETVRL